MIPILRSLSIAALLLGSAFGQTTITPTAERIPLHALPDDPVGGAYGLWAAGRNYKASFHDGFAFYPYRGERSAVRLQWRTLSIRRGNSDLIAGDPRPLTTDWRHELRYGNVTEAYDVKPGGVEQTFVLHSQPAGTGDVVVVGRIGSELDIPEVGPAVQALDLTESGKPIIRYGSALAFDATGRTIDVTTACDGERITLRLPGSFVNDAVYPLTIDPLTSAVSVAFSLTSAPVLRTALAADNEHASGKVMLVFSRQVSANDTDAWGYLIDKSPSSVGNTLVFHDLTTSWSTTELDACHVDGVDRYLIAVQRQFTPTFSAIRVYAHDDASTASNSGTLFSIPTAAGERHQNPQLGGVCGSWPGALLVYEEDPIGPTNVFGTDIESNSINLGLAGPMVGPQWTIAPMAPGGDTERPTVVPCTNFQPQHLLPRWATVWASRNSTGIHQIFCRMLSSNGLSHNALGLFSGDPVDSPAIAGSLDVAANGRYLIAWVRRTAGASQIETRRADLHPINGFSFGPIQVIATSPFVISDLALAHDQVTLSHWALTWSESPPTSGSGTTAWVARLGSSGAIVESQVLASSNRPGELAVTFSEPAGDQRFLTCYALEDPLDTIVTRELLYDSNAGTAVYGNGCNGAAIQAVNKPYAGHEFFGVDVGPLSTTPDFAIVTIGFQQANAPLPWPGCTLLVDPIASVLVGSIAATATYRLPLPDAPLLIGNLYFQGGVLSTLAVTPRLEVRVR